MAEDTEVSGSWGCVAAVAVVQKYLGLGTWVLQYEMEVEVVVLALAVQEIEVAVLGLTALVLQSW